MYKTEICCGIIDLMKFVKKANEDNLIIVTMSENANDRYTVIYKES